MDKFEEVDAKDIKSVKLNSNGFEVQVGNSKLTVTKDSIHAEANSITLDGKVSVK